MRATTEYAGDMDVTAAFEILMEKAAAVLVDVRTNAEWAFVGVPDLTATGRDPILAEWQSLPPAEPVKDFVTDLAKNISEKGLDQSASILFLCRSGVRSQAAAKAMTQAGYANCYNITGGFEGPLDQEGHRGTQSGWKASGLPWIQT
ncbi:rhodanese-like domain-containing protein [Roseibium algae]|uniref:Rhodanese-like domain-containing protein n=1 Tax=Roseibium algae TaxID=3123038 RepID=A0ABU8TLQ9_9HYPH